MAPRRPDGGIMKRLALLLLILPAACVSMNRFNSSQDETAAQKKRADDLQASFDTLKSSSTLLSQDLKATGDQLASARVSIKDLEQSLEANKGELTKKVSDLIKERDAQAARMADLQKQLADSAAAKAAAEAAAAAEIAKTKKSYEDLTAGLKSEI